MQFKTVAAALAAFPCLVFLASAAQAHGFAGPRFFPATIATDDPFVADELSLPTVTVNPRASDGSKEIDVGFDVAKRITRNLGFTLDDQWKHISVPGAPGMKGWDALSTGLQYQLFIDGAHELIGLVDLDVPALVATTYGRILLVKLALIAVMLVLAAVNRQVHRPRLAQAVAGADEATAQAAIVRLALNTRIEAVLGLAVLGCVGLLGVQIPAAHAPGHDAPVPSPSNAHITH